MKSKIILSICCALTVMIGMLSLSFTANAQSVIIREHSAANRSKNTAPVEDKKVPLDEALTNVSSVPLDETECDSAPAGSVQCFGPDDAGTVIKKRIVTRSVIVRSQREAENSIVEKTVIVPQTVDDEEREVVRAVEPQSVSPIDEPSAPIDIEALEVAAPSPQQNPAPLPAIVDAADSENVAPIAQVDAVGTTAKSDVEITEDNTDAIDEATAETEIVDAPTGDAEIVDAPQRTITDSAEEVTVAVDDVVDSNVIGVVDVTGNQLTTSDESVALVPPTTLDSVADVGVDEIVADPSLSADDVEVVTVDNSVLLDNATDQNATDDDGAESLISTVAPASSTIAPPVSAVSSGDTAPVDATTGDSAIVDGTVVPNVVDGGETIAFAAIDDGQEPDAPLSSESGIGQQIALVEQLLVDGQTTRARQVLAGFDTSQPLPPQVAQTGAMFATTLNLFQVARRLWEQNVTESEPYRSTALTALVDLSVASGSLAGADIYLQSMLQNGIVPSEAAILVLADYYLDSARYDEASDLLTLFSEAYPDSQYLDGLLWTRGRLYEAHPNQQDVRSAVQHYRQLVAGYPLSDYWEQAQARATYLERHFIDVR